jgi:hypothetical protein
MEGDYSEGRTDVSFHNTAGMTGRYAPAARKKSTN